MAKNLRAPLLSPPQDGGEFKGFMFRDVVIAAGQKEIVHGASGWLRPGEVLALMGPSGKPCCHLAVEICTRETSQRQLPDMITRLG